MNKRKILFDVFPDWLQGRGLFTYLLQGDVPWKEDVDSGGLDILYFGGRSGGKFISPLVKTLLNDDGLLTSEKKQIIANVLIIQYLTKWKKLYETLTIEYDPIENINYTDSVTESKNITYGKTITKYDDVSQTDTGSKNVTGNESGVNDTVTEQTQTTGISGFNSSTPVDSGKTSGSQTDTVTIDSDRTENTTTNNTVSKTVNGTDTESGTDTVSDTITKTKKGKDSFISTQKLISQEREIQMFDFFNNVVFPDIDKVLTISIY